MPFRVIVNLRAQDEIDRALEWFGKKAGLLLCGFWNHSKQPTVLSE
jgi:hypothetical protein